MQYGMAGIHGHPVLLDPAGTNHYEGGTRLSCLSLYVLCMRLANHLCVEDCFRWFIARSAASSFPDAALRSLGEAGLSHRCRADGVPGT